MSKYVVIESRDPLDSADVQNLYELDGGLAEQADELTVFRVQNSVLPTRRASPSSMTHPDQSPLLPFSTQHNMKVAVTLTGEDALRPRIPNRGPRMHLDRAP